MSFLKRPSPREMRKQKARDFILRAGRPVTTAEVAEHICVTMASTTQLLVEMVQEIRRAAQCVYVLSFDPTGLPQDVPLRVVARHPLRH